MAQITESLFGLTPEAVRAQQAAQLDKQALAFAQLSPMQAAQAGLFRAGNQLGGGIASLLGYQDPEVLRAQQRQGMLSGLDLGSPEALMQAAQTAQRAGDFPLAQALQTQALDLNKQIQTQQTSQTKAATEQRALSGRQSFVKRRYPELSDEEAFALASDEKAMAELVKTPKADTEIKTVNGRVVIVDKQLQKIVADLGQAEDRTPRFTLPAPQIIMPDTRGKSFEEADKEALKDFRTQARASQGALSFIGQAVNALDSGAVVGQGVPGVVRSINSVLAPLGINADTVASTRNLEQALNSVIAQGIKQYGSNPSTVDLEFAKRTAANITDPKEAIKATLRYLEKRASNTVERLDAAEQWLLERGNLGGFEKEWSKRERESLKSSVVRSGTTRLGTKYEEIED